jgi:RHS repeat-associated protein
MVLAHGCPAPATDLVAGLAGFAPDNALHAPSDVVQGFDNANNLAYQSSVKSGAFEFAYDEVNRLTAQVWTYQGHAYQTSYDYDAAGCLWRITYPTGTRVQATCDVAGRPTTVSVQRDGAALVAASDIEYHPTGQVASYLAGNGLTTTAGYDDRSRLGSLVVPGVISLSYGYDGADNVTSLENLLAPERDRTMTYDSMDRLATVTAPTMWGVAQYTYDWLGNRLSSGYNGVGTNFFYGVKTNRLERIHGSFVPSISFTWDVAGRLESSSDGSTYAYSAAERRVRKDTTTEAVLYHYDAGGRIIAETRPDGTRLRDYVYLGNKLLLVDGCVSVGSSCSEREWYHTDALGSVLARTDGAGAVTAQLEYSPWGEQYGAGFSGTPGVRQYNGRVYDQGTGLHDYGARMYWPELGRFISADSYGGDPSNPASLNRYSYVHNNPYKYNDPNGKFPVWVVAGAAIGAAVNVGMTIASNGGWDNCTSQQLWASAASGAVSGALGALAGPAGGTVAKALGFASNKLAATAAAAGVSAVGGATGQATANVIDPAHAADVGEAALWSAVGGGIAKLVPTKNLNTLKQAAAFGPKTVSGAVGSRNAAANLSSFAVSSAVGAVSNFSGSSSAAPSSSGSKDLAQDAQGVGP